MSFVTEILDEIILPVYSIVVSASSKTTFSVLNVSPKTLSAKEETTSFEFG
jgi:hypothetical protein